MLTVKLKPRHRLFCFSVKGHVKMLRLALTVTSMTLFIIAQAPEPYIVVTGFEVTVAFFFIVLYILRLDQLIDCIFWPLLDIINSVVTAVFMVVISVLALIPETTTYIVLGGVFGLVASVLCIADGALIYRKLLFNPSGPYQKTEGPVRHHQARGSTMNPEDDNARSGDSKSGGPPSRSVNVARAAHPERSAPSTSSVRDTSAAPSASRGRTAPTLKPTAQPAIPSQREKKAIQKRAEGRAKVPPKFRDSLKRFLFSPTGILKIIRLGLLIGALVCFIIAEAQESYVAITVLETCIVLFFILIYMLTLHHSMTYLHWSLLPHSKGSLQGKHNREISLDKDIAEL
ncbi:hypothetical protein EI555_011094 [Monodon monoceros]|uniref:MARVEL domain-containing protein n=1 Tax=Monodon monoceros TaxID=40151 RepID=A0A4U1EV69_MONMO|nr:hypothetical protein EI555_011094 [Monodon monoceros]